MAIEGLIDDTHAPFTQLLSYIVVRDGLADHWAEILGLHVGQVNEGDEVGWVPKSMLMLNRHYTHPMREDVKAQTYPLNDHEI